MCDMRSYTSGKYECEVVEKVVAVANYSLLADWW